MQLVIVESPTKAKTITKFLGKKYIVASSYGHVRDLPKGEIGVDVENDFEPRYVIPTKARKKLNELKANVKKVDGIILATDEDREGEAIAWHLTKALDPKATKSKKAAKGSGVAKKEALPETKRIVFHEITKEAIQKALANPRDIDMDLVNAQQARRILDRLVGYKLSPFLWKKIMRGLSAGRVQSVALRLIVEKEREIEAFKKDEYYTIETTLNKKEEKSKSFTALLHSYEGKKIPKLGIQKKEEADDILSNLKKATYSVGAITKREVKRNPFPPFTTSTLQQAASARFGYPAKRTMMLAQNLYERGLITYHRTDSLNLAASAVTSGRSYIEKTYGADYIPSSPNRYKNKSKGAQEAHEAIRPSSPDKSPDKLKLEAPQKKLYELIWQRFLASQMKPALYDATSIDIETNANYTLRSTGSIQKFAGFSIVYPVKFEENELPSIDEGDKLDLEKIQADQHFTQPPARYSEATLVKAMEQHGIGRPSTYATIISTIQDRNYVTKNESKRLEPTEIGLMVTDLLLEHFPRILDIQFTASMEQELDEIAQGKENWREVLRNFYTPFEKNLEKKYEEVEKKITTQETDKKCPECDKMLLERMGRFGKFYACSGFPECRHTESIEDNSLNAQCPKCVEGKITEKRTKRKKIFYGCTRYPDCDFALWDKPVIEPVKGAHKKNQVIKCPDCDSVVVEKKAGIACSNKECAWKKKT